MKDLKKIAQERQQINQTIRQFFADRDFVEVETPIIVRAPGMEPNLFPFETKLVEANEVSHAAALITSPEYSMKKLLALGMKKIFTLTKVFRNNEELGGAHNPEFTMLEWYMQGEDYQACMDETEALVKACAEKFDAQLPKFKRARVKQLFIDAFGIDLDDASKKDLQQCCKQNNIHTVQDDSESDLFYRLFLEKIEPNIGSDPIFLYDYPIHQAALSKLTDDGLYGQRFELYINNLELCNGFTELTDADEQERRFIEEAEERRVLGKTVHPIDEKLLKLLPSIRTPSYGNALGIDRLHMVLTNRTSIKEVLLFPASEVFSNENGSATK